MMVTTGGRLSRSSSTFGGLDLLRGLFLVADLCWWTRRNRAPVSSASFTSSVWLMVAKIFLSTSRLITRLALTPNFSDSSLTVMPSAMVISRSMGGGAAGPRGATMAAEAYLLLRSRARSRAARLRGVRGAVGPAVGVGGGLIVRAWSDASDAPVRPDRVRRQERPGIPGPRMGRRWPGRIGPR